MAQVDVVTIHHPDANWQCHAIQLRHRGQSYFFVHGFNYGRRMFGPGEAPRIIEKHGKRQVDNAVVHDMKQLIEAAAAQKRVTTFLAANIAGLVAGS